MSSSLLIRQHRAFGTCRTAVRQAARTIRPIVRTQAYVEPSVTFAVTQQAIAYAAVLGLDTLWERNRKHAPDTKIVGAGAGATLASVAVINTGIGALSGVGLVLGVLAAGAMMTYHGKRALDADDETIDWPGPKALPAFLTLASFFALSAFAQGIRAEL